MSFYRGMMALSVMVGCGSIAFGWTTPATLYSNAAATTRTDCVLRVAAGSPGVWGAVWATDSPAILDYGIGYSRTQDNGISWTPAVDISQAGGNLFDWGYEPVIATNGANVWLVAWDTDSAQAGPRLDAGRDIMLARSTDGGATWSAPTALNSNALVPGVAAYAPSLATDGNGNWVCVWQSALLQWNSPERDGQILVTRSADNGMTWAPVQVLNSNELAGPQGEDSMPVVATDSSGTWVCAWESETASGTKVANDIRISRSTDNGATWDPARLLVTSGYPDPAYDGQPTLACGSSGTWVVAWTSNDRLGGTLPAGWNILFARSTDSATTFSAPAALNSDAISTQPVDSSPKLAASDGVFTATWTSSGGAFGRSVRWSQSTDDAQTWVPASALAANTGVPAVAARGSRRLLAWPVVPAGSRYVGNLEFTTDVVSAEACDWIYY